MKNQANSLNLVTEIVKTIEVTKQNKISLLIKTSEIEKIWWNITKYGEFSYQKGKKYELELINSKGHWQLEGVNKIKKAENETIMQERREYTEAREKFSQLEKELDSGYLVLNGKQVYHFKEKKEWEKIYQAPLKLEQTKISHKKLLEREKELEKKLGNTTNEQEKTELEQAREENQKNLTETQQTIQELTEIKEKYKKDIQFAWVNLNLKEKN